MGYHSVRLRRGSVLGFAVLLVAAVMGFSGMKIF